MKTLDPGHRYMLDYIGEFPDQAPASEDQDYTNNILQFVKRTGPKYPGNEEPGCDGTTTQEVIRVLIARTKYVELQRPHKTNQIVLRQLRLALLSLETRAAEERHDLVALREMPGMLDMDNSVVRTQVELYRTCMVCGHILCHRHKTE